mmetsp:Transcript_22181/g.35641  ORF Transcript_22181/g.35641 Transcript_22181/m.35641 type:complete len:93 (-) Transcript_22181:16-294(-)
MERFLAGSKQTVLLAFSTSLVLCGRTVHTPHPSLVISYLQEAQEAAAAGTAAAGEEAISAFLISFLSEGLFLRPGRYSQAKAKRRNGAFGES